VTDYLQTEFYQKLKEDDSFLKFFHDKCLDGVFYWDLEQPENQWVSDRFWDALGYGPEISKGVSKDWKDAIDLEELDNVLSDLRKKISAGDEVFDLTIPYIHQNKSTVWMSCRSVLIRNSQNTITRMLGFYVDITSLKITEKLLEKEQNRNTKLMKLQQVIRHTSEHDILTGLPTRGLFMERLEKSLAHAKRNESNTILYFVDVDHFKQVNDCYGHLTGDIVLKEIAKRLTTNTRHGDFCARLSGDEFVVLVEATDDVSKGIQLVSSLIEHLSQPILLSDSTINTSVSIGVASYPECAKTVDELMQCADFAMYQAKKQGGNQYRLYSNQLHQKFIRVQKLRQGLVSSSIQDQLYLEYQPIFSGGGSVEGFEALIRWKYNDEIISPNEFISVAEEHGTIADIGNWVFEHAFEQLVGWSNVHNFKGYVAINLSLLQLRDSKLLSKLQTLVKRYKVEPNRVHLEVTETQMVDSFGTYVNDLKQLSDEGFAISLDDFGTGYASFKHLQKLPLSTLKIDRSFLSGVPNNSEKNSTLDTMFSLAKIMDLSVVVEGVETEQQHQWLNQYRCSQQGFYHGTPTDCQQAVSFM